VSYISLDRELALVNSYLCSSKKQVMTAFKTNTDQFIKQRMMTYLKEQGYNFYQSATLLKLTQTEREEMSRYWAE